MYIYIYVTLKQMKSHELKCFYLYKNIIKGVKRSKDCKMAVSKILWNHFFFVKANVFVDNKNGTQF